MKRFAIVILATAVGALSAPAIAGARPVAGAADSANHPHGAYLGVSVTDITPQDLPQLAQPQAVLVVMIDHDGPAARVGFQVHDIIIAMNGRAVATSDQLRAMLRQTAPGRTAEFDVLRDGKPVHISIVLGDRATSEHSAMQQLQSQLDSMPEPPQVPMVPAMNSVPDADGDESEMMVAMNGTAYGVSVDPIGPQLASYFGVKDQPALLVNNVMSNSVGYRAGFRAGDLILRVNGQPVASPMDWARMMRNARGKSVRVSILRAKRLQTIVFTPPPPPPSGRLMPGKFDFGDDPIATATQIAMLSADLAKQIHDGINGAKGAVRQSNDKEADKLQAQMRDRESALSKTIREATAAFSSPEVQGNIQRAIKDAQADQKNLQALKPEIQKKLNELQFDPRTLSPFD
jgi:serine protease Do